jgi:hypothetical protein
MLTIKRITVLTDAGIDSRSANRLSADFGAELNREWNDRAGERIDLTVDRLTIDAPREEVSRDNFARTVARSTIERLLARRRGE